MDDPRSTCSTRPIVTILFHLLVRVILTPFLEPFQKLNNFFPYLLFLLLLSYNNHPVIRKIKAIRI